MEQTRNVRGPKNLFMVWNQELWLPYLVPSMTNRIVLGLFHKVLLGTLFSPQTVYLQHILTARVAPRPFPRFSSSRDLQGVTTSWRRPTFTCLTLKRPLARRARL